MGFDVPAADYDAFMGRFSRPLAHALLDRLDLGPGARAVDVGCGPGALTELLVERLGADAVAAVDPSEPFVDALTSRLPGVDVRRGGAETLPWPDGSFDLAVANLVVSFMSDPDAGLREMARVASGGTVAVTVWSFEPDVGPLGVFWAAAADLDPAAPDETHMPGTRPGHLTELVRAAGLDVVDDTPLELAVAFDSLEAWWEPFTHGVGPAGGYVAELDEEQRTALRSRVGVRLGVPDGRPFQLRARSWCVVARSVQRE